MPLSTATQSLLRSLPRDLMVTGAEAAQLGIARSVLRGPAFRRLPQGLYVRADTPDSFELWVRAALKVAPPGTALWGHTALRAWGVALPASLDRDRRVHLLAPPGERRPRVSGVLVHQCGPGADDAVRVRRLGGVPLAAPVEAWLQTV
ncbi:MAG: hypothetical protein LBT54_01325, partial [Bifidobacteriaceae bacterium]|nr:hypothetical protein [Bifidobacteriaceae bacterium]